MTGDQSHTFRAERPLALRLSPSALAGLLVLTFLFVRSVDSPSGSEILKAAGLSAVLYAIVILHELGHAAVALGFGLAPVTMRIHALGGATSYVRQRPTPGREAAIAAAGPAVTAVLAVLMRAIQLNTVNGTADFFGFVYSACIVLTIFNLLPGLPLDGGAIVKSLAWALTSDERRATRFAAATGMALAIGLIALGVWSFAHSQDQVLLIVAMVLAVTIGMGALRTWQVYAPSTATLRPSVFDARMLLNEPPPEQGPDPTTRLPD